MKMTLEDLTPGTSVRGIRADSLVSVVQVEWYGTSAVNLTYKAPDGQISAEVLYRDDEARLEIVEQGRPWSFDGNGHDFRLVSEANRIRSEERRVGKE